MDRYKIMVDKGLVEDGIDVKIIEKSFNRIMTERIMAKEKGETKEQAQERTIKEMRFRQRVLREAGLMV